MRISQCLSRIVHLMCNFAMQEITRYDTRFAQNICNLNIFFSRGFSSCKADRNSEVTILEYFGSTYGTIFNVTGQYCIDHIEYVKTHSNIDFRIMKSIA